MRGRWAGERAIAYRIEPDGGPLAADAFRSAITAALRDWQATGCASFHPAEDRAEAELVFAWRRGRHDACTPFGIDPSIAHTGPVGPGTFVHFDAAREWSERGYSLHQAALHEIGHALGLDHSPDEASAMYPGPSRSRARLSRSDLAGIHSLYGGGRSGPGDLVIRTSDDASATATLFGVAPRELTGWDVFDVDGDGRQEVLVWRTDAAGAGTLWSYFFARGPCLERTLGPLYGVVAPGGEVRFLCDEQERRLLLQDLPGGSRQIRIFDGNGLSTPLPEGEVSLRNPRPALAEPPRERSGDLDGDGREDRISASSD